MTGNLLFVVVVAWFFSQSVVRPSGFSSKLSFCPCSLFSQTSLSFRPTLFVAFGEKGIEIGRGID
jgi:hypothetical protein